MYGEKILDGHEGTCESEEAQPCYDRTRGDRKTSSKITCEEEVIKKKKKNQKNQKNPFKKKLKIK